MDAAPTPAQTAQTGLSDDSDYGSDFSPEETDIIEQLLTRNAAPLEIAYDADDAALGVDVDTNTSSPPPPSAPAAPSPPSPPDEPVRPDPRSPLERFRSAPRKGLTVTDLVSPAWCELQYWYVLTIHGRKVRTSAMQRGSAVHQTLEEQIYTPVEVRVETKEDAWGLRIWNMVQGLRTLRETGRTRELEVWGVVGGQLVNGIIDEVSFTCPDPDLEAQTAEPTPPLTQRTLVDYLKSTGGTTLDQTLHPPVPAPTGEKLYITDVKTRGTRTLPRGASFRPTKIQLMLYHTLLSQLASNAVDFRLFATRHDLDASKPFSDSLLAQVAALDDADTPPLLSHNSLAALWALMVQTLQSLTPAGSKSIGRVLTAEYRAREGGGVVGRHEFVMDEGVLRAYVEHEMKWWRGERGAQGVVVEEAWKCRGCEFAGGCEWRIREVEERWKSLPSRAHSK